jgi:hypothetical protein
VVDDRLIVRQGGDAAPKPLEGVDFMLVRVEGRSERPDWRFPEIHRPLTRPLMALEEDNELTASGYRAVAIAAAHEWPEIAELDRPRVKRIKLLYEEAKDGAYGATGSERLDLESSRSRAISREQALAEGPVREDELLT